jgi:hypothetical protein
MLICFVCVFISLVGLADASPQPLPLSRSKAFEASSHVNDLPPHCHNSPLSSFASAFTSETFVRTHALQPDVPLPSIYLSNPNANLSVCYFTSISDQFSLLGTRHRPALNAPAVRSNGFSMQQMKYGQEGGAVYASRDCLEFGGVDWPSYLDTLVSWQQPSNPLTLVNIVLNAIWIETVLVFG